MPRRAAAHRRGPWLGGSGAGAALVLVLGAAGLLAALAVLPQAGRGQGAALPPGAGRETVQFHCSICHDLAIVRQQRLSRRVWGEVLDDMTTYGAVFNETQRAEMLDYLTAAFGP